MDGKRVVLISGSLETTVYLYMSKPIEDAGKDVQDVVVLSDSIMHTNITEIN